jgi:hypothetical protein
MAMLDRLPSMEEMIEALSSPVVPGGGAPAQETQMKLSTDEMIRLIFERVMQPPAVP